VARTVLLTRSVRPRSSCLAVLVFCFGGAAAAPAADVEVRYVVERAPLRVTPATAAIVIELHADAACDAPVASETIALADLQPIVDLTRVRLPGVPRGPRVVELRHVASNLPAVPAVYARVRGAGVVPIGEACQVQTFMPPPTVPHPIVRDSNGMFVGVVALIDYYGTNGIFCDDGHGIAYGIGIGRFVFGATDFGLLLATPDCSGTPYLQIYNYPHALAAAIGGAVGGTHYVPAGPLALTTFRSFLDDDGCHDGPSYDELAVPAAVLDAGRFVPPFIVDHVPQTTP
jgi:hypothetical protein